MQGYIFATFDNQFIVYIQLKIGDYINASSSGREPVSLARVVYNHGLRTGGMAFSFCTMSKKDIADAIRELPGLNGNRVDLNNLYEKCKSAEIPICVGNNEESFLSKAEMPSTVKKFVKTDSYWSTRNRNYELQLDEIATKCFLIEKRECQNEDYLKRKEQYISDRKAFDEHPGLYEKEPRFEYKFEYWLQLTETGEKYIRWYEE